MASLNLYHTDSVAATILYGINTGNPSLAIRASKELFVSGESEFLMRILTLAWLLQDPGHPYEYARHEAYIQGDCETFLYTLLSDQNASTGLPPLPTIDDIGLPKYEAPAPTQWNIHPAGWTPGQAGRLVCALDDTLKRKNWKRAVYLTSSLLKNSTQSICYLLKSMGVHEKMTKLLETTIYAPLSIRVLSHAFAQCTATNQPVNHEKTWQTVWKTTKGRAFTIPAEAMAMWHISHKPLTELIGAPIWVLQACTADKSNVWKQAIGITVKDSEFVFKDDTSLETFYTTYFPNDIPDEWSPAERSKSHGIECVHVPNPWIPAFILL